MERCETCKYCFCAGWHYYECVIDETNVLPYDHCDNYEEED